MPANIGEMFYYGQLPWHGEGIGLQHPADLEEALKVGGLNWEVEDIDLMTADNPPSPVLKRKALVRSDRAAGDVRRVLGVAHREFRPFQNRDAGLLFDAIFGQGRRVYHTGGYLGDGEKVWLMAKLDKTLRIADNDIVEPYALMANSHDGSMAFHIRLTTVRVVCQNTLSLALKESLGAAFTRSHQGSFTAHATAAQNFFKSTMLELDQVAAQFTELTKHVCRPDQFKEILLKLLPEPNRPRNADQNPGILKMWETKRANVLKAREHITKLRDTGKGMDLVGSRNTFWGVLNAITEFVDHHKEIDGSRLSYALLGEGMDLKLKAYRIVQDVARQAA